MLIDTHSHLSFKSYDKDRDEVVKRTIDESVVCVDVGTKYETSERAVKIAQANENIYAAVGMHPIHIKTDLMKLRMDEEEGAFQPLGEDFNYENYKKLALSNDRVVAIGEIGLDYYYRPKTKNRLEQFKELQKKVFVEQLDLAQELDLPVLVHCRMAHNDVLEILGKRENKGVIHCFTGNWEEAQKYINLGFYLGINGIIFKFDIDEVIKKTPLDKILVETDCPYLTPPIAGVERNEPIFVRHVVQKIADLRGVSFDEVASATTVNSKKLFNI